MEKDSASGASVYFGHILVFILTIHKKYVEEIDLASVESLLFVGYQFSWIMLVKLNQKILNVQQMTNFLNACM